MLKPISPPSQIEDLWQSRFGAQSEVIGQSVRLSGTPHTIIGVMPPEFQYPSSEFKLWVTLGSALAVTPQQSENRQARFFRAIAHRKSEVTMAAMQAEMKGLAERLQKQREVPTRIAALPGVQAVGGGTGLPPVTPQRGTRFAVQGLPNDNSNERGAYFMAISPDYFRALGATLQRGRAFSERDDAQSAPVVIINQALAQRLFPNESAVGKRIQLINPEQAKDWREVVGVVGAYAATKAMTSLLFEVNATT